MLTRNHTFASIATTAVLLAATPTVAAAAGSPVAFVDVDVLSMHDASVIENQVVLVEDGRITAIAPTGEVAIPEGAEIIEGDGTYLMPALADMHFHANGDPDALMLALANGITLIQDLNAYPDAVVLGKQATAGEVPGPRVLSGPAAVGLPPITAYMRERLNRAASPLFGVDAHLQGLTPWGLVYDEATAAAFLERVTAAGADFIKTNLFLGKVGFEHFLTHSDLPMQGHVWEDVGLERYVDAGAHPHHCTEIAPYMSSNAVQGIPLQRWDFARTEERLPGLLERFQDSGSAFVPTVGLGWFASGLLEDFERMASFPELRYLPVPLRQMAADEDLNPIFQLVGRGEESIEQFRQLNAFQGRLIRSMRDAGVPLLAGSDCTSIPNVVCGFSLHHELSAMVEYGLTPFEALETATVAPAAFLGEADERGTVSEGKRADLLLLRANPLEDIGNTREIEGVMRDGQWHSRQELDAALEAIEQKYAEG